MAKMYAWSKIVRDSTAHERDHIHVGDEVSKSDFENKDEYDELVRSGAIREAPYPIPRNDDGELVFTGSPREFALAQLAELSEGQMSEAVTNLWQTPALQQQAQKAMDEADYHPDQVDPDSDEMREREAAEEGQESRQALEAQGGKGKGPQLGPKRSSR